MYWTNSLSEVDLLDRAGRSWHRSRAAKGSGRGRESSHMADVWAGQGGRWTAGRAVGEAPGLRRI